MRLIMENNPGGDLSIYNEASLKMKRLNKIQGHINCFNINLFDIDPETNKYNYQLKISALNNLYSEISSKCSPDEKKSNDKWRGRIRFIIKKYIIRDDRYDDTRKKVIKKPLHEGNCELIESCLFDYELFVRDLLEKHGFGSPKQKDPKTSIVN